MPVSWEAWGPNQTPQLPNATIDKALTTKPSQHIDSIHHPLQSVTIGVLCLRYELGCTDNELTKRKLWVWLRETKQGGRRKAGQAWGACMQSHATWTCLRGRVMGGGEQAQGTGLDTTLRQARVVMQGWDHIRGATLRGA